MDLLSQRLDRLGDAVAEVVDQSADGAVLPQARRRLLAPRLPERRFMNLRTAWAVGATLVAVLVIVWVWVARDEPTAAFQVGEPPITGSLGSWVAASEDQDVPLRFSEGSTVTLRPGTRLRVAEATEHGATLLVERGAVGAKIVHQGPQTRWTLRAGPFELRVVGTSFDASWDPARQTLKVAVQKGAIVANGPLLPPDRRVEAGEQLVVEVRDQRMAVGKLPPPESERSDDEPASEPEPGGAGGTPSAGSTAGAQSGAGGKAEARQREAASADASSSWRELAAERKYREAMRELDRVGFEQQVARASASELLQLADVARFAGQPGRARQALLQMRTRHGARGHSAFLLGRISADQLGSSGEAVRWFETYLREAPNGALAEQALGRIVDIQRHGSPKAAQQAAKRYLARYPDGAYAALARSVLSP